MLNCIPITWGKERLMASIHYPDPSFSMAKAPVVIICHGFISTRIGVDRLFVQTADHLSSQGMAVIRFDYIGCGESSGEYGDNRLDDLIHQTRTVIDYVTSMKSFQNHTITLIGHSLGGAVALLTAAVDPRVQSLVLWAPSARPYHDITQIVQRQIGSTHVTRTIDYCGYRLNPDFFASLAEHDPLSEAENFQENVLVVHGTNDEDIPVETCYSYDRAFAIRRKGKYTKKIISGANHTFSSIAHREMLLETTSDWIKQERSYQQLRA
ncbi:alpha/beta hydrolase family protein [Anoxybacteroides rupiense]|uniref:alpha/beta hydrolase family protein n=1 Tax=Anoxybacteroides rupiense TaxID=311460 RepID=UPI001F08AF33|nr:alpha/beta fold hydrolase [Anoxybacillus rupiensis]